MKQMAVLFTLAGFLAAISAGTSSAEEVKPMTVEPGQSIPGFVPFKFLKSTLEKHPPLPEHIIRQTRGTGGFYYACVGLVIGADGRPSSGHILISSGDRDLDEQFIEIAQEAIYAPATLNGVPVPVRHRRFITRNLDNVAQPDLEPLQNQCNNAPDPDALPATARSP